MSIVFLLSRAIFTSTTSWKSDLAQPLFVNTRKCIKSELFQPIQRFHGVSKWAFLDHMSRLLQCLTYDGLSYTNDEPPCRSNLCFLTRHISKDAFSGFPQCLAMSSINEKRSILLLQEISPAPVPTFGQPQGTGFSRPEPARKIQSAS